MAYAVDSIDDGLGSFQRKGSIRVIWIIQDLAGAFGVLYRWFIERQVVAEKDKGKSLLNTGADEIYGAPKSSRRTAKSKVH